MSGFELIAQLVTALAWPVAALLIAFVLKKPLARMLGHRPPSRVKAGPFEMTWDEGLAKAETELQAVVPPDPAAKSGASIREELSSEVEVAPAVAVLEAHATVERELRSILWDVEPEHASSMGAVGLARLAAQKGKITPETANAVEGITVLKNLTKHDQSREVTPDRAADYVSLADAVLYAIRQNSRPKA